MHELAVTSHNWQHNKSTGPDGVSHEAAKALLGDVEWGERIREMLSDMLYIVHPGGDRERHHRAAAQNPLPPTWNGGIPDPSRSRPPF